LPEQGEQDLVAIGPHAATAACGGDEQMNGCHRYDQVPIKGLPREYKTGTKQGVNGLGNDTWGKTLGVYEKRVKPNILHSSA
jgi:hypothetical protein